MFPMGGATGAASFWALLLLDAVRLLCADVFATEEVGAVFPTKAPVGSRQDLQESPCHVHLVDGLCPTEAIQAEARVCVPADGWHANDCTLRLEGAATFVRSQAPALPLSPPRGRLAGHLGPRLLPMQRASYAAELAPDLPAPEPRRAAAENTSRVNCTETLRNYVCPAKVFADGTIICAPRGGWRISTCTLRTSGQSWLMVQGQVRELVQVERGRVFTLEGDFVISCPDCEWCTRAISALGATVVVWGRLQLEHFCTPELPQAEVDWLRNNWRDCLAYDDGGAIIADTLDIGKSSLVSITDSHSTRGSGGAVAALHLRSAGSFVARNVWSYLDGGAVALLCRIPDATVYSWTVGCQVDGWWHGNITGLAVGRNDEYLVASAGCCGTRVYSVATGNEVWRQPGKVNLAHGCEVDVFDHTTWTADGRFVLVMHEHALRIFTFMQDTSADPNHVFFDDRRAINLPIEDDAFGHVSQMKASPSGMLVAWSKGTYLGYVNLSDVDDHGNFLVKRYSDQSGDPVRPSVKAIDWCTEQRGHVAVADVYSIRMLDITRMVFMKATAVSVSNFAINNLACSPGGVRMAATGQLHVDAGGAAEGVPAGFHFDISSSEGQSPTFRRWDQPFVKGKPVHAMAWHPLERYFAWSVTDADYRTSSVLVEGGGWKWESQYEHSVQSLTFSSGRTPEAMSQVWIGIDSGLVAVLDLTKFSAKRVPINVLSSAGGMYVSDSIAVEGDGGALFVADALSVEIYSAEMSAVKSVVRGGALMIKGGTVALQDIVLDTSQTRLGSNVITLESPLSVDIRNMYLGTTGATIVIASNILGETGCTRFRFSNITVLCPNGHEGHFGQLAELAQDCLFVCRPCAAGTVYDPNPKSEVCIDCPIGLVCDVKSDLRNPVLARGVTTEPAPATKCAQKRVPRPPSQGGSREEVAFGLSYYMNFSSDDGGQCFQATCAENDTEMTINGCDSCFKRRGPGYGARPGTACQKLDVALLGDIVSVVPDRGNGGGIKVSGHLTQPGKVKCELCEALTEDTFWWWACTSSTQGCKSGSSSADEPGGMWEMIFGVLRYGTLFEGLCNVTGYVNATEVLSSKRFTYKSPWSLIAWSADRDNLFAAVAGLASCILLCVVIFGRGRLRKFLKMSVFSMLVLVGNVVLGTATLMLVRADENQPLAWKQLAVAMAGLLVTVIAELAVRYVVEKRKRDGEIDVKLTEAQGIGNEVQFPIVLLRGDIFLELGELQSHEELRAKLTFFDNVKSAEAFLSKEGRPADEHRGHFSVFFSHQWTAYDKPDPSGLQYRTMCEAIRELADKRGVSVGEVYCWVDYFSIPQANKHTQRLAINSLPVYASILEAFVVVAPEVVHSNTGLLCNRHSYQQRGWCRAEQLCHCVRRGTSDMYLADSGICRPLSGCLGVFNESRQLDKKMRRTSLVELENWFTQSLYVFSPESHYSCCRMLHVMDGKKMPCDRQALMLPMLGLYGEIYRRRRQPEYGQVFEDIKAEKESIFPPSFTYVTSKASKPQPLFSDLLDRLERKMDRFKPSSSSNLEIPSPSVAEVTSRFTPVRFKTVAHAAVNRMRSSILSVRSLTSRSPTTRPSVLINDVEMMDLDQSSVPLEECVFGSCKSCDTFPAGDEPMMKSEDMAAATNSLTAPRASAMASTHSRASSPNASRRSFLLRVR